MPAIEHATPALAEADRLMTICNSCRYCEGLCAVFPAMEARRAFADGDLDYLANLCHACGACYIDCQFSPPHEFNVNVPKVLAQVRAQSWRRHAWPGPLASLFARNGLAVAAIASISVAAFIAGFVGWEDPDMLWASHRGPGAFYRLMPHDAMAALFGGVFVYAIAAMFFSLRAFWRGIGEPIGSLAEPRPAWQAVKDAGSLRYLDGSGAGCHEGQQGQTDRRKFFHHLTFYGFMACFAATIVATLYHYLLGRLAPYPWYDLPVVLGTLGGIGLLIGPAGLMAAKFHRDPDLQDGPSRGMDMAFLVMLFLTSLTGLALLALRHGPAMGLLLAVHLGVVFALFLTMPYGKFVHGLYRYLALVRYAKERRQAAPGA